MIIDGKKSIFSRNTSGKPTTKYDAKQLMSTYVAYLKPDGNIELNAAHTSKSSSTPVMV